MNKEQVHVTFDEYCELVNAVATCMDDYLYFYDIKRDLYYISKKALERFAIPSNLFSNVSETLCSFVYKDDIAMLMEDLGKMTAGEKDRHDIEYRWLGKDGQPIWINCRGRSIRDENGKPIYMIGCVNEIGEKQRADNVSGLKKSTVIREILNFLFVEDDKGYILHIGIDNFRAINEHSGMEYGNFVLRGVANCIINSLTAEQEVYHLAADEYIIVDLKGSAKNDAHQLYHKIRANVDGFIEENQYECVFTISGGSVASKNIKGLTYTDIIKLSQFALSEAKERGKNQIYLYDEADYKKFLRKREILSSIRESIAEGFKGFEVFYQPIMKRNDSSSPYAAEALLRYQMNNGESISPYEFIPIVEESGLIIPIGKWVMKQAMAFCKERQHMYPEFKININVSYVQVLKSPFLSEFFRLLKNYELSPSSIVVELTESGNVENSLPVQKIWEILRNNGVSIALDDFGTGYSNLLYISKMTPHVVKLDRGFTAKAMQNQFERQLMTNTIQLVHSLGLKVCVEGVETEEDLIQIHQLGADYIQGYYYSKPCPQQEFIEKFN